MNLTEDRTYDNGKAIAHQHRLVRESYFRAILVVLSANTLCTRSYRTWYLTQDLGI